MRKRQRPFLPEPPHASAIIPTGSVQAPSARAERVEAGAHSANNPWPGSGQTGLSLQGRDQVLRQHGHPVFVALTLPHDHLAPRELHILHPQAQRLQQTYARAIEPLSDEPRRSIHVQQQLTDLGRREHHRQTLRPPGLHHLVQPRQFYP